MSEGTPRRRRVPAEHDHHERSRWPFVGAVGAGALYVGAALYLVGRGTGVLPPVAGLTLALVGVGVVVVGLAGWLGQAFVADYWARRPGPGARRDYRAAMLLFLGTDLGTFGALFAYYFFIRVGAWPPTDLPALLGSLVLANTGVLVASSFTLHFAHEALDEGNRRRFVGLLAVTVALGVVFLAGQAVEYFEFVVREGFTLTSGVFGSAFFGLTGLHGLHVALGVVMLGTVLARALGGQYASDRDASVATTSLYWHFVDAVWLLLVLLLYVGATA
ncbi:heme-copper oxidase subunit III [Halobacteriaceae archaeon GCM10025711]